MTINLRTVTTPEAAAEAMTMEFVRFFRAGGVLSWANWEASTEEERLAAQAAGDRIVVERNAALVDEIIDRMNESDGRSRADAVLDEFEEAMKP